MNVYSDKFTFSDTIVDLKDFTPVDPSTFKLINGEDVDSSYFRLSKSAKNSFYRGIEMGGAQFSDKLFSVDAATYMSLVKKKMGTAPAQKYINGHYAVVVGDTVLSLIEGQSTHLSACLDSLNKFYAMDNMYCEFEYEPRVGQFMFTAMDKDTKEGVLIRVYTESLWVTVNTFYIDNTGLTVISPYTVVDKKLDEDIETVLDTEVLLDCMRVDALVRKEVEEGLSIRLSVDELSWYLKKVLGIKLKSGAEFDPHELASDKNLSESATQKIVALANAMFNNYSEPVVYYISYLKRAVTMSPVTYGVMAEVVDAMHKEGYSIEPLISIYDTIMRKTSHYHQLNQ